MEKVLEMFQSFDKTGTGLITYAELQALLQFVDPVMTEDNFKIMMEETGASGKDQLSFKDFVGWLNGDNGAPAVTKAQAEAAPAAQEAPESDSEEEIDDEEDVEALAAELEAAGVDLDLERKFTCEEWVDVMRELEVDSSEAKAIYDDTAAELGGAEGGLPLRELLEELKVEVEDLESLRAIADAHASAKEKRAKGEVPAAEEGVNVSPQVMNVAVDKVVRALDLQKKPADEAWEVVQSGKVPLSKVQRAALDSYEGKKDELVAKVKGFMLEPPMVNSAAGQNACRELCVAEVDRIIAECKAAGKKFTDPEWDLTTAPEKALYVDSEAPGWDCTVAKPAAYKRVTELVEGAVLFKGGVRAGDIIQGQIGTCFLLGAMGAIVSNSDSALRKIFVKHDVETGVYGVRFCLDGEWTYVVVDDLMPVDQYGRLMYAHSKDPQEVWCALLEKAYCKLHTCYEMCDGGFSTEAIFNFFGGVSGKIDIKDSHKADPKTYFTLLKQARSHGWLLTVHFTPKAAAAASSGKCGEATFESGLVGGHCYSVLKVAEANGEQLVCCRNPWGTGEWTGKWSDENAFGEWTKEMKDATGYLGSNDGKFWMSIEDFIANTAGVDFARTFGPNWKKVSQYKYFSKKSTLATAQYDFSAGDKNEISFEQGDKIEVEAFTSDWWRGRVQGSSKEGFFPGSYVTLDDRPVSCFELVGTPCAGAQGGMTALVLLLQPNAMMERRWYTRKEDGLHYKDTSYPALQLVVLGPDGSVAIKKEGNTRSLWGELSLPGNGRWRIFALSTDGKGDFFTLRCYVKGGTATLTEVPGATL